jgi:solute carrier family 25 S-adenosylmethionine transporter 26
MLFGTAVAPAHRSKRTSHLQPVATDPLQTSPTTDPAPAFGRRAALTGTAAALFAGLVPQARAETDAAAGDPLSSSSTVLDALARGVAGGATVAVAKKLVLYPLDTIRCRLEVAQNPIAWTDPALYRDLYAGLLPNLLVSTPASAVFFGAKTALTEVLAPILPNKQLLTIVCVGGALIPHWIVRNPAEVLKTRRQAGTADNVIEETKRIIAEGGPGALYVGYGANLLYGFPADCIKFLVYDTFKGSLHPGTPLNPTEAAVLGAGAGLLAALATTPLDVVRTRIMAEGDRSRYASPWECAVQTVREGGWVALWSGVGPRLASKVLSNAIQFGSFNVSQRALGGRD